MLVAEAVASEISVVEQFVLDPRDAIGSTEAFVVDAPTLSSIAQVETVRGPVAVCRIPEAPTLPRVDGWVMVADAVSDPGNLGTIVRCAEIAGASAVVVTKGTTDQWSPKCVRASAGAIFHVPIVEVSSLADVGAAGFSLIGTTSHPSEADLAGAQEAGASAAGSARVSEMESCDFSGRIALVLGNESRGLAADSPVDRWVSIRHVGRGESLNVAMAGAILSMHVARAREVGRGA